MLQRQGPQAAAVSTPAGIPHAAPKVIRAMAGAVDTEPLPQVVRQRREDRSHIVAAASLPSGRALAGLRRA